MVNMKDFTIPFQRAIKSLPKNSSLLPQVNTNLFNLIAWITESNWLDTTFQVEFVKYWISDISIFLRKVMQNFFFGFKQKEKSWKIPVQSFTSWKNKQLKTKIVLRKSLASFPKMVHDISVGCRYILHLLEIYNPQNELPRSSGGSPHLSSQKPWALATSWSNGSIINTRWAWPSTHGGFWFFEGIKPLKWEWF